jgi:phospholipid/cholesterol/gamma-HCH transport system ATP-binding protein
MLFDDSTTGLDPVISATVDDEIVKLRDLEDVTSIVVTQQIRDAVYIATHKTVRNNGKMEVVPVGESEATRTEFMVLHEGRIIFTGSAAELMASKDPYLERFLYRTVPPW